MAGVPVPLVATIQAIPDAGLPTVAVGALTIVLLLGLEHFVPKLPAPLVAVAGGIAAVGVLGLQGHGVAVIGEVPQGLPSLILPDPALIDALWPGAFGVALMSFTETIAALFGGPAREGESGITRREMDMAID